MSDEALGHAIETCHKDQIAQTKGNKLLVKRVKIGKIAIFTSTALVHHKSGSLHQNPHYLISQEGRLLKNNLLLPS